MSNLALTPCAPEPLQVWSNSSSNKGHITLETDKVFIPPFAAIARWWLKYLTLPSTHTLHNHCKLGPSRTVTKGTLFWCYDGLSSQSRYSLQRGGSNANTYTLSPCSTTSATLLKIGMYQWPLYCWDWNNFSSLNCHSLQCGGSNMKPYHASTWSTTSASLVEIAQ
jgi:hypothetical protein